jgi:hypothetical protein
MHIIVLLGLGYIGLFLIPASIRNPRWFLAVWGLCVAFVTIAFVRYFTRSKTADPLAQMFDRALLDVAALAVILALFAFGLRRLARRNGWTEYPHWLVLTLGSAAVPAALFARFAQ